MPFLRSILLVVVVIISCYCPFIQAAEKGGNGVFGADLIALQSFKRTGACPKVNPKNLCGRIYQKMDTLKWEVSQKTEADLNEESFFYNCCFNNEPLTETLPPKKE